MPKFVLSTLFGALLLSSTAFAAAGRRRQADAIYFNGDILTMASKDPGYAEAMAVDGRQDRLRRPEGRRWSSRATRRSSSTSRATRCCRASSMATAT